MTILKATKNVDVLLVTMPFGPLFQPSLGLSLLKETLLPYPISTKILYLTMAMAEKIGTSLYNRIANGEPYGDLVGERIFADALFPDQRLDLNTYVNQVLRKQTQTNTNRKAAPDSYIEKILSLHAIADDFLGELLEVVLSYQPKIIGFTSVFQQQVASLALAQRIKQRAPDIKIIFGGANCEGQMGAEVIRQFHFVDAVVSGEGEPVFPELVQRLLQGQSVERLQGVYTQHNLDFVNVNGVYPGTAPVRDMDSLPVPDYSDYFEQLQTVSLDELYPVRILFETSRGCWWGERKHCTFCGLNGATMTYRSKQAARAIEELGVLRSKYPGYSVFVVDNILDMNYFKDFIPELAAKNWDLELFYEVKANLTKHQLELMRSAGITTIQPGIESLHSHVLQLMRKGVSGLQNIQLLKWCQALEIEALWNIIWGFPGELPEDYEFIRQIIPLIFHLHPPIGSGVIRLDRFSPNFDHAHEMGFVNLKPFLPYQFIYPFAEAVVFKLAYHFEFDYASERDVASYTHSVAAIVNQWRAWHEETAFFMVDIGSHLLLWDFRPIGTEVFTILSGLDRLLYLECDGICTRRQLVQAVQKVSPDYPAESVEELLASLVDRKLMVSEGNSYLSLALPASLKAPHPAVLEQFYEAIQVFGTEELLVIELPDSSFSINQPQIAPDWFAAFCFEVQAKHIIVNCEALRAYIDSQKFEYREHHLPQAIGGIIVDV